VGAENFKSRIRTITDGAVTVLAILATVLVVLPLVVIFGYLVYKGASSLNLAFFTEIPKPEGENGGGMANAIVVQPSCWVFPAQLASRLELAAASFWRNTDGERNWRTQCALLRMC